MIYKVWDISYDTDGDVLAAKELPSEMFIEIDSDDNIDDQLSDAISDLTGFCHFGFKYDAASKEDLEKTC